MSQLGNLLAFFECLDRELATDKWQPVVVLYLDLADLSALNREYGWGEGERALRWLALAMRDELPEDDCFRLRGDEFAAVLVGQSAAEGREAAQRIQARFARFTQGREGPRPSAPLLHQVVLSVPPDSTHEVADILIAMESVMQRIKQEGDFLAESIFPVHNEADLRATVSALIDRVMELGAMLDQAIQQAESDPLTGLPNMRAMMRHLEAALQGGTSPAPRFALLLVDGDNLRAINKISYAAGDAMIRELAGLLAAELRQHDHLARWRLGDEFLILLPGADAEEALSVAERLVACVRRRNWQVPVTISIGVALCPDHGTESEALTEAVEAALSQAKEEGKNRALLFQP